MAQSDGQGIISFQPPQNPPGPNPGGQPPPPAGGSSNPTGQQPPPAGGSSNPPGAAFLDDLFTKVQSQEISSAEAVGRVLEWVNKSTADGPETSSRLKALYAFVRDVEDLEKQLSNIQQRGDKQNPPAGGPSNSSRKDDRQHKEKAPSDRGRRSRTLSEHSEDSGGESEQESENENRKGRSNKKRVLYESEMPWRKPSHQQSDVEENVGSKRTRASQRKTCKLLDLYAVDIKRVKVWIQRALRAPLGFPESEWEHIIRGRAVDLNAVFSSLHSVHPAQENTGRLGDFEIIIPRSEPLGPLSSHSRIVDSSLMNTQTIFPSSSQLVSPNTMTEFCALTKPSDLLSVKDSPSSSPTVNASSPDLMLICSQEELPKNLHVPLEEVVTGTKGYSCSRCRLPGHGKSTCHVAEGAPATGQTAADWTLSAKPLPPVPLEELSNPIVRQTIHDNPHLFKVSTPVNISKLHDLLATHPNRPFVESILHGFREGFWPWAHTLRSDYPVTLDASMPPPKDTKRGLVLISFQACTRCLFMPCLNLTRCAPLIHHLSPWMVSNTLHKTDVKSAYRLIPMHPCWQIKQVNTVTVNGQKERNVDWFMNFGGTRNIDIWISFMSLVLWIAREVKGIQFSGIPHTTNICQLLKRDYSFCSTNLVSLTRSLTR